MKELIDIKLGDENMEIIEASEVSEGSPFNDPTYAPVVDSKVVEYYNRLIAEGKLKLFIYDLNAGEVNYGSFSVPRSDKYNEILFKSEKRSVICGDLKTGRRERSNGKMRDQQFWLNGLTKFWDQYPMLKDIAFPHKGKGEKNVNIAKKLFGVLETEKGLELVFTPILEKTIQQQKELKKKIVEQKVVGEQVVGEVVVDGYVKIINMISTVNQEITKEKELEVKVSAAQKSKSTKQMTINKKEEELSSLRNEIESLKHDLAIDVAITEELLHQLDSSKEEIVKLKKGVHEAVESMMVGDVENTEKDC